MFVQGWYCLRSYSSSLVRRPFYTRLIHILIPRCRRRICFTTTACAEAMDSKYKISVYGFGFAGSADYSELQKALGDYLPLLLGLTFTGNLCLCVWHHNLKTPKFFKFWEQLTAASLAFFLKKFFCEKKKLLVL